MTMLELLENDKKRLIGELSRTNSPEKTVKLIEEEADRLLLLYNQSCEVAEKRDAAAGMLLTAKLAAGLADVSGETSVWKNMNEKPETQDAQKKKKNWPVILLGTSIVILLLAAVVMTAGLPQLKDGDYAMLGQYLMSSLVPGSIAVLLAGICGWYVKKSMPVKASKEGSGSYRVETQIDEEKIYVCLHNMIFAIDQELDRIGQKLQEAALAGGTAEVIAATGPKSLPENEILLLSNLLEAEASGDGDFALERIGDVRYYLHRNGIQAVDYDGSNAQYFDLMPSKARRTLRPALMAGGTLIRKGMASDGRA